MLTQNRYTFYQEPRTKNQEPRTKKVRLLLNIDVNEGKVRVWRIGDWSLLRIKKGRLMSPKG